MVDSINQKPISTTGLLASATAAGITGGAIAHFIPKDEYRFAKEDLKYIAEDCFTKEGKLTLDKVGYKFLKEFVKGEEDKIKTPIQLLKVSAEKGSIWAKDKVETLTKCRKNRIIIWTTSAAAAGAGIYLGVKALFKRKKEA